MDYEMLWEHLPKETSKWTVGDIGLWLTFIGLQSLIPIFKSAAIDGSCLSCLTEEDMREELEIKSSITIKKLSTWLKQGIKEYDLFLKNKQGSVRENPMMSTQSNHTFNFGKIEEVPNSFKVEYEEEIHGAGPESSTLDKENIKEGKDRNELVLQQCDGPSSFFILKEQGGKIGRHSSNNILILEESVSRFHAEIEYEPADGDFYLKDIGSTTGTFIKISSRVELEVGMIIEMGSNQFLVTKIIDNELILQVIQGLNLHQEIISVIKKNSEIKLGRKSTSEISFPDDPHLSNSHCIFLCMSGKIYLEDNATTNGTWLRLGEQQKKSSRYLLKDRMMFKVGSTCTYTCYRNANVPNSLPSQMFNEEKESISSQNLCSICYQVQKDCVFMPCKHNACCIKCSKAVKECPICRNEIHDFIKIYR